MNRADSREWDQLAVFVYRACLIAVALTLALSLLEGLIGVEITAIAGLLALIGWIYVGLPVHVALAIYVTIRAAQGAGRQFLSVFVYLAVFTAASIAVALATGLGAGAEQMWTDVKRQVTDSEQVALEEAVWQRPVNPTKARANLAEGADPDGFVYEMPLLLVAASRGNLELVEVLLEFGATVDLRARSDWGSMQLSLKQPLPLELAVQGPAATRSAVIAALLDAGADPGIAAMLPVACSVGDIDLYEQVLSLPPGVLVDGDRMDCLHHAIEQNHDAIFRRHLDQTGNLNQRTRYNQMPLDRALQKERWSMALALVEAGADNMQPVRVTRALAVTDDDPTLRALQALLQSRLAAGATDSGA